MTMTCLTCSPYYAGVSKAALCKVYLPMNTIYMVLFIYASFFLKTTGPGKNALLPINLWHTSS